MKKQISKPPPKVRPPIVIAVFGKPNSGKSYLAQQLAAKVPHTVVVYNHGHDVDWEDYEKIEIIKNPKSRTSDGEELLFEYKGEAYEFAENFPIFFKNKRVKIGLVSNGKEQEKLFNIFQDKRLSNTLFIVDDTTVAFTTNNMTAGMRSLLGKAKHNKVDVMLIAHSMDAFPPTAFAFLTNLILFETTSRPAATKLSRLPFSDDVLLAYGALIRLPLYSYYSFSLNTGEVTLTTITNKTPKTVSIKKPRQK